MRKTGRSVFVLGLLVVGLATAWAAPEAEGEEKTESEWALFDELHLGVDNFDEEIGKHEISAVFFYAPWCGHCKNAKPEWAEAAKRLAEDNIPLFVVNADEADNRPLAQRVGLSGFPSIYIFRKSVGLDKPTTYEGGRTADAFVANIKSYSGPASEYLEQADESLISPKREDYDHTKVTVIAFVDKKDSDHAKTFESAVDQIRTDGSYYHTENYAIAKAIHGDLEVKPNTILLFRHFDGEVVKSKTIGTVDEILSFIEANYAAPFITFTDMSQSVASRVYSPNNAFNVFVHAAESKKDEVKAWASKLPERLAETIGSTVVFDAKGENSRLQGFFGFNPSIEVSLGVVNLQNSKKKFVLEESADLEKALKFVEDVKAGKVKPYVKSAPIPTGEPEDNVKVVVGDTFEKEVLGSGKNVFFKIYAPWCGHCKAMAPAYKDLADALEEDKEVVVAKLDGTENDVLDERFDARGYPALFFMNSEGKVEAYKGGRTFDDMLKYIEDNKTPVSADVLNRSADDREL
ncbi:protein disulfide-isomerase [Chloropicon primus]|uniref:Protein disulfide-isomerase n=1 Tax=Chloropicon primus TaxID=1764295 RepID=A0A5B8MCF6_9CHLO|nr:protein disulfide-isomerase [Chloropicon primus]UPQ97263.1 protein disulfide-isomerase [Chloropicon primus]|eukprot:QDZ18049.1 protein disulfide-isomerase [Chloropicon primus]